MITYSIISYEWIQDQPLLQLQTAVEALSLETSIETLRRGASGAAIVKWRGAEDLPTAWGIPEEFHQDYTHEEILEEIAAHPEEWSLDPDEELA